MSDVNGNNNLEEEKEKEEVEEETEVEDEDGNFKIPYEEEPFRYGKSNNTHVFPETKKMNLPISNIVPN